MAFNRPSLADIIARVFADIRSRLPGVEPTLRRSASGALGAAEAGAVHGLYGNLEYLAGQILPDTAETAYLARHAALHGIYRKAAVSATGLAVFTGVTGSALPAGTLVISAKGQEYSTAALAALEGGTATVAISAVLAGDAGDLDAGSALALVSAVPGVDSSATVAAGGLSGGEEEESDNALRDRLLAKLRNPPQGGSLADYQAWALSIPGITRVWVVANGLGLGTVLV
jgi:uncharacterized phage protein gp47/JayE